MTGLVGFGEFSKSLTSPALRAVAQHWNEVRGTRPIPAWADLSSTALSPYFKLLWGFDYDAATQEFVGRLAGNHIKEWLGANFLGAKLHDLHPPRVVKEASQVLSAVVSIPAISRCSGRLFTIDGRGVPGECIALPMGNNGVTPNGVLGVSFYEFPGRSGAIELVHENIQLFRL